MKNLKWLIPGLALGWFISLLPACGTSKCDASTCTGCCDANDKCQAGDFTSACGANGGVCQTCGSDQMCQAGFCRFGGQGTDPDAGTDAGVDAGPGPICTTPILPACTDQAIQKLGLLKPVAPELITNSAVDGGFVSRVDATAGAPPGSITTTDSFVYGKFTPTGLTKVSLGDEAALDSMAWDIAFRRYIIRLNGGNSGSSCVAAAELPLGASYEGLTTEPAGLVYKMDTFYADTPAACTFVTDGSGLDTPSTALTSYYSYTNCVETTGRVFIVRTAEGRRVKLIVDAFYSPASAQTYCNANHMKESGAVSANLSLRWAFLD